MSERQRARMMARYQAASPDERGRMIIALWCYAAVFTGVNGGLAGSLALSAARIWRHREQGLVSAVRDGGHWRAVVGFALASAALRVVGKSTVDRIVAGGAARPSRPGADRRGGER